MSTTKIEVSSLADTPPQTFRAVFRAELRRLSRRGGMRRGVLTAFLLATAAGSTTAILMSTVADSGSHLIVTTALELCAVLAGFVLALSATSTARHDGEIVVAMTLVPNRGRLFLSRLLATATLAALTSIVSTSIVAVIGTTISRTTAIGLVAAGVLTSMTSVALLVALAFSLAVIVRHVGAVLLTFVGLTLVLPLASTLSGSLAPDSIAAITDLVIATTPTPLLFQGVGIASAAANGFAHIATGQLGLASWAVATALLAAVLFARRDA